METQDVGSFGHCVCQPDKHGIMDTNGFPSIEISNPVVDLLQTALNDAKSGKIAAIAMVVISSQGGLGTPFAGAPFPLMGGTAMLLGELRDAIKAQQSGRPAIIRAVPM